MKVWDREKTKLCEINRRPQNVEHFEGKGAVSNDNL